MVSGPKIARSMSSSPSLNIFLVENHADTLLYLGRYLEQNGHKVRSAREMGTALMELQNEPADVLICDIGLPDGDGWELMEKVSTHDQVPFGIAMSGYSSRSDREKSLASGFRYHLVKPFLPEDLDALLQKAAVELAGR